MLFPLVKKSRYQWICLSQIESYFQYPSILSLCTFIYLQTFFLSFFLLPPSLPVSPTLTSCPFFPFQIRILALLQHSFPWKNLQLERLPNVSQEAGNRLLLRSVFQSQDLPTWPGRSDRYGIHEIHHAIQQYVACFSRHVLQNTFPSLLRVHFGSSLDQTIWSS